MEECLLSVKLRDSSTLPLFLTPFCKLYLHLDIRFSYSDYEECGLPGSYAMQLGGNLMFWRNKKKLRGLSPRANYSD
jgi:hypothetical protein